MQAKLATAPATRAAEPQMQAKLATATATSAAETQHQAKPATATTSAEAAAAGLAYQSLRHHRPAVPEGSQHRPLCLND